MMSIMVDISDLHKILKDIGLNKQEADVFEILLPGTPLSILDISRKLSVPRTNVYRICDSLVKKNIAEWAIQQRGNMIKAIEPEKLSFLVQKKEAEVEGVRSDIQQLKQFMKSFSGTLPKTQLKFYQGVEGMKQLIWNTLRAEREILGYSIYGRKAIVGETFSIKYIEEFKIRNLRDKTIVSLKEIPKVKIAISNGAHQQSFEDVRVVDENDFEISGDTYLYNNTYAVSFWNEDEIVGVEIENPEIVKVQRSIFNFLWSRAIPIKKFLDLPA